jgi:hypothetical protein
MWARQLITMAATFGIGAKLGSALSHPVGAQIGSPRSRSARLRRLREVRDVDNPGRQAVVFNVCTDPARCPSQFNVPAGKRLVIEYVSARLTTPVGQASAIGLTPRQTGSGPPHISRPKRAQANASSAGACGLRLIQGRPSCTSQRVRRAGTWC